MSIAEPGLPILALNTGSSSLKFGLYSVTTSKIERLFTGEAEAIGNDKPSFNARDSHGNVLLAEREAISSYEQVITRIVSVLSHFKMPPPAIIGHRIVHGGPTLRQHCLIDGEVLDRLESAIAFAPLHTPPALSVIRLAKQRFPGLPHAACFDTAFHSGLPEIARTLPLPKELRSEGIQRYGFHGLSYESIVDQLGDDTPDRLVIAHLGNGASITAVKNGKSIDTSMGLTPTGGVIMGTRSGDLDPGILIYLMREKGLDALALEELVDRRSGLAGISGLGSDMRNLHQASSLNEDARLAIEMFCYSVRKQLAAMIAALEGIDMLVFTGGIGENDAAVRAEICDSLSWSGVVLDPVRNRTASNPINDSTSRCSIRVLPSQEDEQIARHSQALYLRSI
ncbi:MAG: acetate kinase [Rhodospirillales bacterium]|nr:acetate kinase [Rhodospirillales bacterium]